MEMYARGSGSSGSGTDRVVHEWGTGSGLDGSMRRLAMWERADREPRLYPERPGFPNCEYYLKTGSCGFGYKCRYNHPRDRAAVIRFGRGGEPPERPGEPPCQFYLRTGTCKFGASCKFHHPKNGDGFPIIRLNSKGYPLRQGEPDCSYYLKTGQCKFGLACKFNHPEENGLMPTPAAPPHPFYPSVQAPPVPTPHHQFQAPSVSFRDVRPPPPPGSFVQPGTFGPVLVSPGVVPVPSWSGYAGPVSSAMSVNAQPTTYAPTSSAPAPASLYHAFPSSSSTGPSYSGSNGSLFPMRPGEPDCQFFVKTGTCKFSSNCKFNHPDWVFSKLNCPVSAIGLPLRPGVQPCSFYLLNGHCKFGRMCKFDHPMSAPVRYSPSASSLSEVPVAPYIIPTPLPTLAPSFPYAVRSELETVQNRGASSANASSSSSVGLVFQPNILPALFPDVQFAAQPQLAIGMSPMAGGEVRQMRT